MDQSWLEWAEDFLEMLYRDMERMGRDGWPPRDKAAPQEEC